MVDLSDANALRRVFSCSPSGVSVISLFDGDRKRGITVSSLCSLSLDPPLCMYALEKQAKRFSVLVGARTFGVNILSSDQEWVAKSFSLGDQEDLWNGVGYKNSDLLNLPILNNVMAFLECEYYGQYDGGDHVIIIGKLVSYYMAQDKFPLIFGLGKFNIGSTSA